MKMLVHENNLVLFYTDSKAAYRFILYHHVTPLFTMEICRGWNLTKKFSKYLSSKMIDTAKAKVHAINYVNRKFK